MQFGPTAPAQQAAAPTEQPEGGSSLFSNPLVLLFIILERWWLIALCVLLTGAGGAAFIAYTKPIYRATTRIEIMADQRMAVRGATSFHDRLERSIARHILKMKSKRLHQEVRQFLRPDWEAKLTIDVFYTEYYFETVRGSGGTMLDVIVDAVDKQYAREYLDYMIEVYDEIRYEELEEINNNALKGLRIEEEHVAQELDKAKNELYAFENENQVLLAAKRQEMDNAFINQLFARQKSIVMERTLLDSQYEDILNADVVTIREALDMTRQTQQRSTVIMAPLTDTEDSTDPASGNWISGGQAVSADTRDATAQVEWEQKEEQLSQLEKEYEQWLDVRNEGHPEMQKLRDQIEGLKNELVKKAEIALKRFQARYKALQMQEDGIEKVIESWKNQQALSITQQNRYRQLRSTVAHLQKKYDIVYTRLLENANTSDIFYVRVIEEPNILPNAVKPDRVKILAAAIVAGLGIGCGLILLIEYLRPETLSAEFIERSYHVPYLRGIPEWDDLLKPEEFNDERDKFVLKRGKNQAASETYRALRAKIASQFGDAPQFTLAVSSSKRGDGKTFNCLNLALTYVWDGKRVLLMDGDFRRSSLTQKLLDQRPEEGWTGWFHDNEIDVRERIIEYQGTGLHILPAGKYDDSIPERVKEESIRALLSNLHNHYDIIIIDTAPVTMVVETIELCRAVDGVMIMADQKTHKHDFRYMMRELQGVRIIGFCINKVKLAKKRGYGYGYGYGYGGSYEHYQYGLDDEKDKRTVRKS